MSTTQVKNGWHGGTDDQLLVNPDGSINVNTSGGGGGNASVGPTGTTAPTSGTEVAGIDPSGNLHALQTDSTGALVVTGSQTVTGTVTSDVAGLNHFQTSQYSIGVTAVQITPTPLVNRSSISLRVTATGQSAVYIGTSAAVSTSNGYPLYNGDTLQMDLTPTNTIYGISDAPGQIAYVLEIA